MTTIVTHSNDQRVNQPNPRVSSDDYKFKKRLLLALIFLSFTIGITLIIYWTHYLHGKNLNNVFFIEDPSLLSNWHVISMYVFMFTISTYSILVFKIHSNCNKLVLKVAHSFLASMALVSLVVGIGAMFRSHKLTNKANFYSFHSWIGSLTTLLYLSQLLIGFIVYLNPKASQYLRSKLMSKHKFAGTFILMLTCVSVITGVVEYVIFQDIKSYSNFTQITYVANFAAFSSIISTVITVYLLASSDYSNRTNLRDDLEENLIE